MCNCNKGVQAEKVFTVTYPDGRTEDVQGENAARIKVTTSGGGRYEAKTR